MCWLQRPADRRLRAPHPHKATRLPDALSLNCGSCRAQGPGVCSPLDCPQDPTLPSSPCGKKEGVPSLSPPPHLHLQKSRACTHNDNPQPQRQFPAQRFSKCFTQSPSLLILVTALQGQVHVPAVQLRRWRPRGDGTCLSSNSKNCRIGAPPLVLSFVPSLQNNAVQWRNLHCRPRDPGTLTSPRRSLLSLPPRTAQQASTPLLPPGSPAGWVGAKTPG